MDDLERKVQKTVLERLPLAKAIFLLFSFILDKPSLDDLYDRHRGRNYQGMLSFDQVVRLVWDALTQHGGSGNSGFTAAQEAGELPTCTRAVYGKLERMPLAVSMALLREPTLRLASILSGGSATPSASSTSGLASDDASDDASKPASDPASDLVFGLSPATILPASLAGLRVIAIDGKTVKHVQRRLHALRRRRGKVTSGKGLVALELESGLALAMQATQDSDANDVSLVDGLLEQLEPQATAALSDAAPAPVRLYLADAQFCDLPRLQAFSDKGHHFLVRHNANVGFHRDPDRAEREGKDSRGRRWVEQWGWLGSLDHPLRRYVRRITLFRPDQKEVSVVSDLLDEKAYPAQDLLDTYLERWGIEQVFQQVTQVFNLQNLIGGKPAATLFQMAFCLLLYNLIQVVRVYVARAGEKKVSEVSSKKLFESSRKQMIAVTQLLPAKCVIEGFTPAPAEAEVRRRLDELLGDLWKPSWLKSPKQAIHRKTKKTVYPRNGSSNVWKVLQGKKLPKNKAARIRKAMQLT